MNNLSQNSKSHMYTHPLTVKAFSFYNLDFLDVMTHKNDDETHFLSPLKSKVLLFETKWETILCLGKLF